MSVDLPGRNVPQTSKSEKKAFLGPRFLSAVAVPYIALLLADAAKGFLYYISYLEISPLDLVSAQRFNMARPWIYGVWVVILASAGVFFGLWEGERREIV